MTRVKEAQVALATALFASACLGVAGSRPGSTPELPQEARRLPRPVNLSIYGLRPGVTKTEVRPFLFALTLCSFEHPPRFKQGDSGVRTQIDFGEGGAAGNQLDFDEHDVLTEIRGVQLELNGHCVLRMTDTEGQARRLLGAPDFYGPETAHLNGGSWNRLGLSILFRHNQASAPADDRYLIDSFTLTNPNGVEKEPASR